MSDLISRQDAIDILTSAVERCKGIYGDLGGAVSGARELIKSAPSAEATETTGNHVHLCDSCRYSYPDCPDDAKVIFGDGKGHDNICACSKYESCRRGSWENYGSGEWHCSVCGYDVLTEESWKYPESDGYNYCPRCGCNMG